MVVWLIGLSGSGKTTLAKAVVEALRAEASNVVLVDGDDCRAIWGDDLGYSLSDRRKNADRICRLCETLDKQGLHVICSILSLFEQSRQWNRKAFSSYYEVLIETSMEQLRKRDSKSLYSDFDKGFAKDVAGLNLVFNRPSNPDLVIVNNESMDKFLRAAPKIALEVLKKNGCI